MLPLLPQEMAQNHKTVMEAAHYSKKQMNTPYGQPNDKTVLQGYENQGQKLRPIPELKKINKCPIANPKYRPSATEISPTINEPSAVFYEPAQTKVSVNNPRTLHKASPHNLQHSVNSIVRDNRSATNTFFETNFLLPRYNCFSGSGLSGTVGDSRILQSQHYYPVHSHSNINSTRITAPPYNTPGHIGVDPLSHRSEIGNRGQYTGAQNTQGVSLTSKQTLKRSNARYSHFTTSLYNSAMLNQKYNNHYSNNLRAENISFTHNNTTASNPSNQYNINDPRKYMSTHQKVRPGPRNTIIQKDTPATPSLPSTHQLHPNYLQETQPYGIAPHMQRLRYSGGSITSDHTQNILPNTSRSVQNSSNARISSELFYNSQLSVDPRYSQVLTSSGSTRSHTIGTININQEQHLQGVTKRPVTQKRSFSTMQSPYSFSGMDLSQPTPISQNQMTAHIDLTDDRNILNDNINALQISSSHPHSTPSNEYTLKVLNPAEINSGQNRCSQQINSDRTESIVLYKNDLGIQISASQNHLKSANQECQIGAEKNVPAAYTNTSEHISSPKKTQVAATNNKVKIASSSPHISALEHRTISPIYGVECQELVLPSTDIRAERTIPAASSENMASSSNPQLLNHKILSSSGHISPLERMPPIKGYVDVNCHEPVLPSTQKHATEQESSLIKLGIEVINKENSNTLENLSNTDDELTSGNSPPPANESLSQETITEEEFMDGLNSLINQLRSTISLTPVLLNRLCGIYARTENQQPMRRDFSDNNNLETSDDTVSSTTCKNMPAEV